MDAETLAWLDSLSPEERAQVESGAREGELPVQPDGTVESVVDVKRAREEQAASRERLARALASRDSAMGDMMGSIGQRKAVPTAWGPILQRETPIMQMIKGLRAYKTGQTAKGEAGTESAARERAMQGTATYGKAGQAINAQANDAAYQAALREAMRKWREENEEPRGPISSPEWIAE